jgi:hypothetical protein
MRIITSMQNSNPSIFGWGDGLSTKPLPKLPKYGNWDSNGGAGMRHVISRAVPMVDRRLGSAINKLESPIAQGVARAFLAHTLRFIQGLSTFITDKYQELVCRSAFSSEEAWLVVATQIKRIFWDISEARIEARDVGGGSSGSSRLDTASTCIWATFRAHQVMADYLRHNFSDHPNMASELVNHLLLHLSNAGGQDLSPDLKAHKVKLTRLEQYAKINNSRLESLEGKFTGRPKKAGGEKEEGEKE